jgi:hypothetical protein
MPLSLAGLLASVIVELVMFWYPWNVVGCWYNDADVEDAEDEDPFLKVSSLPFLMICFTSSARGCSSHCKITGG